jgi:hypothetical protein
MKEADFNGDLQDVDWVEESGLIAQDLLKIPELSWCVGGGKTETENPNETPKPQPYSVAYHNIEMYHLRATIELDTLVQNQQTEIEQLKNQNTLLKNALNTLLSEAGKPSI